MNSINFDAIQFNLVEEAYSILLTLILLLYMLLSAEYRQKIHRYFRMTLIANIASILGSMTDWLFSGINTPAARAVITFGSSLSFFANGCILTCYFLFFLAFLDKLKKTDPRWVTLPKIIFAVSTTLSVASLWFNLYFHIDEDGRYVRGPLFPVSILISLVIYCCLIILMFQYRKLLTKTDMMFMSSFYILPLIAEVLQIRFLGYDFLCIGVTVGLMLVFIRILVAHTAKLSEEKALLQADYANQTLAMLANAIDAKDPYTKGHASRVAIYSALIAGELGWSEEQIKDLRFAAMLHDIGKIGIPDCILNKPSRLTDIEYGIIKTHTTLGAGILKGKNVTSLAEKVAMHHHERYDGHGYPTGLAGTDIPLEARLVCIADSYDAMSSKRVYRSSLTPEYIRNELVRGRGTQFDPELLDTFLKLLDEGTPAKAVSELRFRKNDTETEVTKELSDFMAELVSNSRALGADQRPVKDTGLTGPYSVSKDDFSSLIHYLNNLASRYNHSYEMLDILISFEASLQASDEDLKKAMAFMHQAIRQSLRTVDIFTPLGDSAYRIILLDAEQDSLDAITERILKAFYRMYTGIPVKLDYSYVKTEHSRMDS